MYECNGVYFLKFAVDHNNVSLNMAKINFVFAD